VSGHFERSSEIQDFEKRRAAAARQAAYRRRRRLGLIMVAFEVIEADLTAAGLARQLLGSAGATREELPERHPACRRREARPGFRMERENLCLVTLSA
jgi:hypothetical protein